MGVNLLIGLGNPGRKYKKTRHNIGYIVLDALVDKHGFEIKGKKFKSRFLKETFFGKELCFVKPETFMNVSGEAVSSFLNYFKVAPRDMLVVHDDIDLPFGKLRFAFKSGHGGHNGIRSIVDYIDTNEFYRLKIGIGRPVDGRDPADYVLDGFSDDEKREVAEVVETALQAINVFYERGFEAASQLFNK